MNPLPPPVAALLAATEALDTAAFVAVFADDGVVDDWGRTFQGARAIRGWSDAEFIGKRVTLELTGAHREGPEAVITALVGGEGFNGPSSFAFRVVGDRISRMTIRG